MKLMASYGSAVELGLEVGTLEVSPTTLYLFAKDSGCGGSCAFCPQSARSQETRISRVEWRVYPIDDIEDRVERAQGKFHRICLQCADEVAVRGRLPELVSKLSSSGIPISISSCPIDICLMEKLKKAGTNVMTIPIDCASEELFPSIKGRSMAIYMKSLYSALRVFGRGRVGTHIIAGLGESERDLVLLMIKIFKAGIIPALFAFTPTKGTLMEGCGQPELRVYRRMQFARHLIVNFEAGEDNFEFDEAGGETSFRMPMKTLEAAISDGKAFMTSGCAGCNRPFFNERVSGPIFNFARALRERELSSIREDVFGF